MVPWRIRRNAEVGKVRRCALEEMERVPKLMKSLRAEVGVCVQNVSRDAKCSPLAKACTMRKGAVNTLSFREKFMCTHEKWRAHGSQRARQEGA